eukprot:snap_masked-scaffold462_size163801-processed-gene-0.22 protein:Tk04580 transcript:snap_masked-scaffold462_size163801-processed-gene-0.22-mRNA-1 annotation:"achain human liver receptor homologue dna-binding domain (hlrh-1 dbd) in complex with dsdna from the hcyp7a1 promoter"
MGGFDPNSLALVTKDVVVIHNRSHIKFIFLRSGRSRCLDPKSNRGLDTIGAHDELEVLKEDTTRLMEDISMNFNLVDFIDGDWSQELVSPTSLDPGCDKVILSNNDITDILALEEVDNLPQGRQGFKDTQDAISKSPAQAQNGASEAQLCPVCQRPTGTHAYYGVRVCVSCRGFFRRTVQNEHNVLFRCLQDQMCTIDSTSRRSCKYCRYKQCLQAGMKPQLVMSSADRKKRILQKYQNNEGPLNCDANLTHVRRAFGLTTIFTTEDELEVGQEFKVFLEFSHEAYINHFSEHLDVFGELIRCAYLGCIYPVHLMRSMDHLDEATTANYLFLWVEMRDLSPFDRMTLFQNNYPLIYGLLWGTFSKRCAQMEIIDLAFNRDQYLLGLSGIPDFKIILWDWKSNTLLFSQAIVGSHYDVFKNKLKTLPLNGVALTGLVSENDPQKIRLFPHFQGLIVFKEQRVCSLRSSGGGLTLHLEHSLPEPCGNLNLVQEMSTNCSFVAISEKANFILVQTSESNISSQIVASGPLHFCLFTQAAFLSPNLEHLITIDTNKIFRCHSMGTRSLIFEHTLPSRSSLLCQGAPSELFIMDQNGGVCHFSMLVHERGQTRGAIQSIQPINENGVDLAAHNQSDQTRAVLANCSDGQLFLVQFHPQHPYLEVKAHLEIGHKLCDLSFRSNTLVALIGCKGHWAKHVALIQVEFDELVLKNVVAGSSLISGSCLDEGETSFFSISRTEPPEMVKVSMEHGTISIIPETDPSPTNPTNRQQDQQSPARGIELIGTSLIVFGLNGMVSFYNYFEGQLSLERKLCLFSNLESIVTFHHVPSPNLICGINSLGGLHVLQLISGSEGSADIEAGTLNISESPLSFQPSRLAELQAQALEKTQMPHRDTLHDISSGLQGIKEQVEILLRENEALPPANQVDRHDFELDLEEKQAIEHKGFEQEHELQLELQAHCIARSQIKGRIRLQIWDPMEVKGKTIEAS